MADRSGCTLKDAACDGRCERCGWHRDEIRRRKMILERDGLTQVGPVRALEIKDGAFREVRCPWCQGRVVVRL